MKARNRIAYAPRHAALLGLLVLASSALAQEVIAPPPAVPTAPRGFRQIKSGATEIIAPSETVSAVPEENPWLEQGLTSVRPHLSYRLLRGDGIQSNLGQPATTTIQSIAPGVLFGLGIHWTLDYTPTWTLYSNHTFRDTVDHAASLQGGYSYGDWSLGISQSYISASPTLIETGQQTRQETYSTEINASRRLGIRTRLEVALSQSVRFADAFTSFRDWSASGWLHDQLSSRLDAAVGLSGGYVNVSAGSDMTYARPQGQLTWQATDKLSMKIRGGIETRSFRTGGEGDMNSPAWGASVQYQPVETTTLALEANRDVTTSYFANQIAKGTGWSASLRQRLLQEFYLSVGAAQRKTDYVATEGTVTAGRDDRNYAVTLRLSTTFLRRGSIAVLYQKSHNSSNSSGYGFSSNQFGLEVGYRF